MIQQDNDRASFAADGFFRAATLERDGAALVKKTAGKKKGLMENGY